MPAMIYDVDALAGDGTIAEPQGYPIVDPSADLDLLLVDAYVVLRNLSGPVLIQRLERFDVPFEYSPARLPGAAGSPSGPHAADVVLASIGGVVFDSRLDGTTYRGSAYGPRLWLHEWENSFGFVRLVQRRAFVSPSQVTGYDPVIVPTSSTLAASCVTVLPPSVSSIGSDGQDTSNWLTLRAGYNVGLSAVPLTDGLRTGSTIKIDVIPGAGDGRYPGCDAIDSALRSIGGVGPDALGNLTLDLDRCLWARPAQTDHGDTIELTPGSLVLGNDCPPCCQCSDFIELKRGIDDEYAQHAQIADDVSQLRDQLRSLIVRWNEAAACRESHAVVVTVYTAGRQYADIHVQLFNRSAVCLTGVTATILIDIVPITTFTVVPQTTYASDLYGTLAKASLLGSGPVRTILFDRIQPGATAVVRFRIQLFSAPDQATVTAYAGFSSEPDDQVRWLPQTNAGSDVFGIGEGLEG
jgi:hypothetical protein